MSKLPTGPTDLETLARHVAQLASMQARSAASITAVPAGAGRNALEAEGSAIDAQLTQVTKQLKLAEAYAYYRAKGKWSGAPHPTTTAEKAALRKANNSPIGPAQAASLAMGD
tara:strand:+ start:11685 stop:12023 length:339 start_codon:yes stop_codon:yes gene_type:complete